MASVLGGEGLNLWLPISRIHWNSTVEDFTVSGDLSREDALQNGKAGWWP
jgi:hypothetical protein